MKYTLIVVLLLIGHALSAAVPMTIYTENNAPEAPALKDLPLQDTVTQYGITWYFKQPVRVGTFVNGDFYVVGPCTVEKLDPKPQTGSQVRHGSMLNPAPRQEVAFDSGVRNWYRKSGLAQLPISMKPGDVLISSISLKEGENAQFQYHSSGKRGVHDNCPTKVAAVLCCVAKPLPADAFRPAYGDKTQSIYLARHLKRHLLPKIKRVGSIPDPVHFSNVFQKPWLNFGFFGFDQPMENMPHYGQWVGQSVGNAALMLCLDFTPQQKERLLVNFIQVGIDYWGLVKNGHPGWQGWGGHGSGRKLPIVFAGHLLGDAKMAAPTKVFPQVEFGEDNQTRYGDCWTGAKVVFAGHSGVSSKTGEAPRSKWGPYEHKHPKEWKNASDQKNMQSEAYRRANTSCAWVAQALALRFLLLEDNWNHEPFFDYVDRWMFEDDEEHRRQINMYFPDPNLVNPSKTWCHQGHPGDRWVGPLWKTYRTAPGMPETNGWQIGERKIERIKPQEKAQKKKRARKSSKKKAKQSTKIYTQWDEELIKQVIAAQASGKQLHFQCSLLKGETKVAGATAKTIKVQTKQMALPLPWKRLSLGDKASLAEALAKELSDEELNHALAGVYLKGTGDVVKASKYLAKASSYRLKIQQTFD